MRELFVPGRLCLFGEHSDWAGSYRSGHPEIPPGRCLVVGTDQGLRAEVEPLADHLEIASELPGGERVGPERVALDGEALDRAAVAGDFFSYAAGAMAEMRERHGAGGLRLLIRSDLPVRKGLSSSAAISVLVARAASRAYDLSLSIEQEMDVAYAGERRTGSECGRMDQICAFGRGPVAMHIDGEALRFQTLRPGGAFHLLIVDLCRGKDTRRILSDLNACFPDTPGILAAGVRRALGEGNRDITARAEGFVVAGDVRGLGELMSEAQAVFDELVAPASAELAAPRLHAVLAHPLLLELAWGAKGVGSQGDGCAQVVARGPEERDVLATRLESQLGVRCLPLSLAPA